MRKLLLSFALLYTYAYSTAQQTAIPIKRISPEQHANMLTDEIAFRIEITPQQKQDIYDIQLEMVTRIDNWIKDTSRRNERDFIPQARQSRDSGLRNILTKEQYEIYSNRPVPKVKNRLPGY